MTICLKKIDQIYKFFYQDQFFLRMAVLDKLLLLFVLNGVTIVGKQCDLIQGFAG